MLFYYKKMTTKDRYNQRGVSADKEDVHSAIKDVNKGIFPKAFCKIVPDYLSGAEDYCLIMHADGAGTVEVQDLVVGPALPGGRIGDVSRSQGATNHVAGTVTALFQMSLRFLNPDFGRVVPGIDEGAAKASAPRGTGEDGLIEVVDGDEVELVHPVG